MFYAYFTTEKYLIYIVTLQGGDAYLLTYWLSTTLINVLLKEEDDDDNEEKKRAGI